MHWVFWAMVGAAVVHSAEEYFIGWVDLSRGSGGRSGSRPARRFSGGISLVMFAVLNAILILLCVIAALVGLDSPAFSLSIAVLFIINAVMHLVPLVVVRRYSPGAISALVLFLPLAIYAFYVVEQAGKLTAWVILGAVLLGWLWQAIPAGMAFFSSTRAGRQGAR